ncbi:MMPL family transporter [Gorillibacterium massiliense]|uniref:MMPL family transporter n=1 Tax=Gorillibacterium massiliense TaxID=1280390 RepID=UPI0004B1E2F4|nr:MMPL family transporter [Gorillibacterium massiliense]
MKGLERFAGWVAGPKSKWVTLLVWILLVGALSMTWPSVNKEEDNGAANLPQNSLSVQADAIMAREFPGSEGVPALLVWHRSGGLSNEDLTNMQKLTEELEQKPLPDQTSVVPLHRMPLPALKATLSQDGSTLVLPVLFAKGLDASKLKTSLDSLKTRVHEGFGTDPFAADVRDDGKLSARVTGPVGISIDATGLFKNADVSLLIATVSLVLVLLLLIYRSPLLAIIPIIAVGFAYGLVGPILGKLAEAGVITVDSQAISIMTVLLFGAGTDYCLFLVAHFRQELTEQSDPRRALFQSVRGSAGAIAMSGLTVVLSLFALLLAKYGAYHRFAVPFSLSILIMGLASLTLVPALLAIFGRASFYPFIPRTPEMNRQRAALKGKPEPKPRRTGGFGQKVGNAVTAKPWQIVVVTIILLGACAAFVPQIKMSYDLLSSFPKDIPSREGFAVIADKFTPGQLAPVTAIADTEGKAASLKDKLATLPHIASVSEPQQGKEHPSIVAYTLEFDINPYSSEAMAVIPQVRSALEEALGHDGIASPADKVWVAGQTAAQYDNRHFTDRDTDIIVPVILGLIALLLLLYLRSVTAVVYLVLTVLLSFFSALGLGWIILHYGFGAEAIQGAIPLYSFVFLVALGEDYNIFMISSIWQKAKAGMPIRQAIREGVAQTGSVITSAGLILAGTFAVLTTLPIQVLLQFGLVTAIGVLLDTFLVRPFLVPAITVVLGRAAFWPGKPGTADGERGTR